LLCHLSTFSFGPSLPPSVLHLALNLKIVIPSHNLGSFSSMPRGLLLLDKVSFHFQVIFVFHHLCPLPCFPVLSFPCLHLTFHMEVVLSANNLGPLARMPLNLLLLLGKLSLNFEVVGVLHHIGSLAGLPALPPPALHLPFHHSKIVIPPDCLHPFTSHPRRFLLFGKLPFYLEVVRGFYHFCSFTL